MGPIGKERKALLRAMNLPTDEQMRNRLQSFLIRSGLNISELGEQIGYSHAAVRNFRNGNYGSNVPGAVDNSLNIKAVMKEFMDRHDVDTPLTQLGTHYPTEGCEKVRLASLNALRKGTAYVVDGPPGTEKTWSMRQVEREINERKLGRAVYVYTRVNHSPHYFLQEICCAAGIPNRGKIDQLIRKLRFFLASGRTLLMIDEAQHLDHAGLEVLRQLLDQPPFFGVVLAGSHDLTQRLSHWQMEQWRSRVRKTIYLNGPSQKEAAAILRAEMRGITAPEISTLLSSCMSHAERVSMQRGKPTREPFEYISARDLFFAIERAQEALSEVPTRKGVAA